MRAVYIICLTNMTESEKKPSPEKPANTEKGEKTPPMFGAPIFNKDKSDSLSLAVLKHIGEKPDEHESMVKELKNEVAPDGEEFLPEEPEEQPQAKSSVSARICLPPEPPLKEHEAEKIPAEEPTTGPEFGEHPDEETIATAVLDEIRKRTETEKEIIETKGFTADGDRARIVLPDDPTDPDRVARLTRMGLGLVKLMDKNRDEKK